MAKMTIDNVTYEGTPEELVSLMKLAEKVTEDKPEFTKGERVKVTGSSVYGRNKDGEIGIFDEICDGYYSVDFGGEELLFETHQVAKVTEDVEPAESITFEGAEYALVSRKAQAGDVVVFTENDNSYFTNGKPYGAVFGRGTMVVTDNEGDALHVYNGSNGRTSDTTLVYEKVSEETTKYKRGDLVRYTSAIGSSNSGRIVEVVKDSDSDGYTQVDFAPHPHGICTQNPESIELVARAKDRVDTK